MLEISSKGGLSLSLVNMAVKALKGISRPKLLLNLNYLRIKMNEISRLYKTFPENIAKFPEWKEDIIGIYDKIKKMIVNTKKSK